MLLLLVLVSVMSIKGAPFLSSGVRRWMKFRALFFLIQTSSFNALPAHTGLAASLKEKGKEEYLYRAFYILCISQSAQAWITQFYLQIHLACISYVSVHQMAPPLSEVRDIQLQLTAHLSTPKG